jgi:acyl-CoA synthetase (NDP forming)
VDIQARHGKPLYVCWNRIPDRSAASLQLVEREGVPWALTPVRVAHAAGKLYEFTARRGAFLARRAAATKRITQHAVLDAAAGEHVLSERRSKAMLASYGIAVTREVALSADEIAALKVSPLPFPLAVKVDTPDIAHKTEAGAVRIGINNLDELKAAAEKVIANARRYNAAARIDGVLLAEMAHGTEVIIGVINDKFFGPVVMLGLGGVITELLKDVTYRFAPFDLTTAREMIHEIKTAPLLTGYRGKPALAVDKLAATLVRVSELIADHTERIAEIDINPLFVNETGVVAADALIVLR